MTEPAKVVSGVPPRQCRFWVEVVGVSVAYFDHATPDGAQRMADKINAALSKSFVPKESQDRLREAAELFINYLKGNLWAHSPGSHAGDACSRCIYDRDMLAKVEALNPTAGKGT